MNRIIVVDGNSLLFRAYYATFYQSAGTIMQTKDGIPTNAIYAFSNMMSKLVSTLKDKDCFFVSFDTGEKTFRHDALATYKAQRKPIEESLKIQLPIARELLKAMNIPYFELVGHEGDDIAGTVAKKAAAKGYQVEIVTSDKDFLQLIDDHIEVHLIKKGLQDPEIMNETTLKEKMGLTPQQIPDYKGLVGDSSDNLKGIDGIGDKTAVKLLTQYGTLENIIEALKDDSSKLAEKIRKGKEEGLLCKQIATIELDVPIPFEIEELEYMGYDFDELSSFYTKYEFSSLLKKLKVTDKRIKKEKKKDDEIELEKIYINSFNELPSTFDVLIADIEGSNYRNILLRGFIFAKETKCYYLPYNAKDADLISYLEDDNRKKDTFDAKSLALALKKDHIELKGVRFDLLLASYLLKSSIKQDPISIYAYFGYNILSSGEINLFEPDPKFFFMASYLEKIKIECLDKLQDISCLSLYNDVELPLSFVLADMENEGFPLDASTLSSINARYQEKLDQISEEIMELAGDKTLNISSPKQIADLLFNKLNLPNNKKSSTSIEVLQSLKDLHPIVNLIIEHRKYSKLVSTYSSGLSEYILEDQKIHASFNQALTTTGRLSSSEPNLQNISVRSEEGKEIRKAFFYKEEDIELLSLDYSQIELRILASLSNCTPLIEAFKNNEDIHEQTARKIFSIPDNEKVPTDLRRKAKTINFGIVYGISDWGLSEQLEISVPESKRIITRFYEHYPEIKNYFDGVINFAKNNGYVETLFHRRRYIPELQSDNYQTREFGKRAAMNAPIQGTAADLIKIAMVKIYNLLKEKHYKSKIVLQIHDELILKVYQDEKEQIFQLVKETMENAYLFACPLNANGSSAKTWYDAK